jgi:uncharacterized membrane protein
MKTENPYVGGILGLVTIVTALGLAVLVVAVINLSYRRAEEHNAEIEREEAKVLAEKCKLVSNSVRADPYITERTLSLHICNDQGVSTYFVTRKPFP